MRLAKRSFAKLASLALVALVAAVLSIGCESYCDLVIENQTSQSLTIYRQNVELGTVDPGAQITQKRIPTGSTPWLIEAKDAQRRTVFSKSYKFEEMQYMGSGTYKIVITASQE